MVMNEETKPPRESTFDATHPLAEDVYNISERLGGQSERERHGFPLDSTGNKEKCFIRNPDSDSLVEISPKEATRLVLEGKGSQIIKPWQLG